MSYREFECLFWWEDCHLGNSMCSSTNDPGAAGGIATWENRVAAMRVYPETLPPAPAGVGLAGRTANSRDAFNDVRPFLTQSFRRFTNAKHTFYLMAPCIYGETGLDSWQCPPEVSTAICGWYIEGDSRWHYMVCRRQRERGEDVVVDFGGHTTTRRMAFLHDNPCLVILNIACLGKQIHIHGEQGNYFLPQHHAIWNHCSVSLGNAKFVRPTGLQTVDPPLEFVVANKTLEAIAVLASTPGHPLEQIESMSGGYVRSKLDWWSRDYNVLTAGPGGTPLPCGEWPLVITVPARLAKTGCPIEAEIVIKRVEVWMSLQLLIRRTTGVPPPVGGEEPGELAFIHRDAYPAIQFGIDVQLAVRLKWPEGADPCVWNNPSSGQEEPVVFVMGACERSFNVPYEQVIFLDHDEPFDLALGCRWRGETTAPGWTSAYSGPVFGLSDHCCKIARGLENYAVVAKSDDPGVAGARQVSGGSVSIRFPQAHESDPCGD